jgi:hypothetical protein
MEAARAAGGAQGATAMSVPRHNGTNGGFDEDLVAGIADGIGELLLELRLELKERLSEIDTKVSKLESTLREFRFAGPWREGVKYFSGNFVSHGGALFCCCADSQTKPGTGSDWTLVAARGRDGRDYVPPAPPERRSATMTRGQR